MSEIYVCDYVRTLRCVTLVFHVIVQSFANRLSFKITSRVRPLYLKATSFVRTFRQSLKTNIFIEHNEIQIFVLRLASGLSVNTKCDTM